jgi:hypothetical protein
MASVTRKGDVVTLTMSTEEALYVAAELGGGNSVFHGEAPFDTQNVAAYDRGVFPALTAALKVGGHKRGPLAERYRKHLRVSEATRPVYDSDAGRAVGEREGFLEPELAATT